MYQFIKASSPGGTISIGPWDIINAATEEENDNENSPLFLRVMPGLIGNTLPSNWDEIFEVDRNEKAFFTVEITISSSNHIELAEIKKETNFTPEGIIPIPWGLPTNVTVLFGIVENGVIYRTIRAGDISVNSKIIVTTSEQTNEFIPYINYYTILINGGENDSFMNFGYGGY